MVSWPGPVWAIFRIVSSALCLGLYVKVGVEELDREKLSPLLKLKYNNAIADAVDHLGRPEEIGYIFACFQKYLYQPGA